MYEAKRHIFYIVHIQSIHSTPEPNHKLNDNDHFYQIEVKEIIYDTAMWWLFLPWSYTHTLHTAITYMKCIDPVIVGVCNNIQRPLLFSLMPSHNPFFHFFLYTLIYSSLFPIYHFVECLHMYMKRIVWLDSVTGNSSVVIKLTLWVFSTFFFPFAVSRCIMFRIYEIWHANKLLCARLFLLIKRKLLEMLPQLFMPTSYTLALYLMSFLCAYAMHFHYDFRIIVF